MQVRAIISDPERAAVYKKIMNEDTVPLTSIAPVGETNLPGYNEP